MELENATIQRTEFDINWSKQEVAFEKLAVEDTNTINFLKDLYSFPPKFTIGIQKTINETYNSGISEHPTPPQTFLRKSKSLQVIRKKSFSLPDYVNGFLNKIFTSRFYTHETKPIKKALESIPTYVIFNGREELVLIHNNNNFSNATNSVSAKITKKIYEACGNFQGNSLAEKVNFGLIFLDYEDAKIFMDSLLDSDVDGSKVVGLSIHCVNLGSTYNLIRKYHEEVDFRFIPNMRETKVFLNTHVHSGLLFQESSYNMLDGITFTRPFYKAMGFPTYKISVPAYTIGVPVYIIRLQDETKSLLHFGDLLDLNDASSSLYVSSRSPFFSGPIKKMLGDEDRLKELEQQTTYVFFDQRQALDFCKKNSRRVVRLKDNYIGNLLQDKIYYGFNFTNDAPQLNDLIKKPAIFVTSLENLLEKWENNLLEKKYNVSNKTRINHTTNFSPLFVAKKTQFMIPERSAKYLEKINELEINDLSSALRKIGRALDVRFKIFKYTWNYLLSTY